MTAVFCGNWRYFDLIWILLIFVGFSREQPNELAHEIDSRQDHFCYKILHGKLDSIELKSFTFYKRKQSDKDQLVIFESNRKYYVNTQNITTKGIPISDNYFHWSEEELSATAAKLDREYALLSQQSIESIYYVSWGEASNMIAELKGMGLPKFERITKDRRVSWHWSNGYIAAFICTNQYIFKANIYQEKNPKLYAVEKYRYVPFSMIPHQPDAYSATTAYLINRDLYDWTYDFVIYDMSIQQSNFKIAAHNPMSKDGDRNKEIFYHLRKTNRSDEIALIERNHYRATNNENEDWKKQQEGSVLFDSLPRGFRHESDVYLFDVDLKCVYVIHNLTFPIGSSSSSSFRKKLNIFPKEDIIILKRTNIPWEEFFHCRGSIDQSAYERRGYNSKRCDYVEIGSNRNLNRAYADIPEWMKKRRPHIEWNAGMMIIFAVVIIIGISLFAIVFCVCRRQRTAAKNKPNLVLLPSNFDYRNQHSYSTIPTATQGFKNRKSLRSPSWLWLYNCCTYCIECSKRRCGGGNNYQIDSKFRPNAAAAAADISTSPTNSPTSSSTVTVPSSSFVETNKIYSPQTQRSIIMIADRLSANLHRTPPKTVTFYPSSTIAPNTITTEINSVPRSSEIPSSAIQSAPTNSSLFDNNNNINLNSTTKRSQAEINENFSAATTTSNANRSDYKDGCHNNLDNAHNNNKDDADDRNKTKKSNQMTIAWVEPTTEMMAVSNDDIARIRN